MKKRVWIIALLIGVLILSGCGADNYDAVKAQIRNLYGENEIISGDYDDSLADVCNIRAVHENEIPPAKRRVVLIFGRIIPACY